jgi:hypothetical protein
MANKNLKVRLEKLFIEQWKNRSKKFGVIVLQSSKTLWSGNTSKPGLSLSSLWG